MCLGMLKLGSTRSEVGRNNHKSNGRDERGEGVLEKTVSVCAAPSTSLAAAQGSLAFISRTRKQQSGWFWQLLRRVEGQWEGRSLSCLSVLAVKTALCKANHGHQVLSSIYYFTV